MRTLSGIAIASFIGVAALTAPASAATMMTTTGAPLSQTIKTNSGGDGTLINFFSDPSHLQVDYSSTSTLHASSTGGFAFVEGVGDNGFVNLTLTPDGFTFSDLKFNLKLPAADGGPTIPNGYNTDFTFNTTVYFSGGGMQTFSNDVGNGNGENRFLITGDVGEAISKVVFSKLVGVSTKGSDSLTNNYNFGSLRQVSFDQFASGVPEPSTWALFILGFGAIGLMMRSRRQTVRA